MLFFHLYKVIVFFTFFHFSDVIMYILNIPSNIKKISKDFLRKELLFNETSEKKFYNCLQLNQQKKIPDPCNAKVHY